MQRSGGAVIHMLTNSVTDIPEKVSYKVGSAELVRKLDEVSAKHPFDDRILDFMNDVSKGIMKKAESRMYPDVVTFGFWIRKASLQALKNRFCNDEAFRLGKGVLFHIAPSNVPVNFAYSLAAGLMMGNANVVRIPSKDFPQVSIITDVINDVLSDYEDLKPYVILVRYERDKDINDLFSSLCDVRVIWGGDNTIEEIRRSPLPPRSGEVTFADRYSLAVIDSDRYMEISDKDKVAEDFYNDTFLTDQNACTSPRIVVWTGNQIGEAKGEFWKREHAIALEKYGFQPIQGIDKLVRGYLVATAESGVKIVPSEDNIITRVQLEALSDDLMDQKGNSGFFFEYDCKDISDIRSLCNDKHCQTVSYIGDKEMFLPLAESGIKGIDRIVPVGKTMDFDMIWDGYNLSECFTRYISLQ